MKPGKYNLKEFFVNRYLQKIVIPEIQRDYVWGKSQVKEILNSIVKDYNKFLKAVPPIKLPDQKDLENDFFNFYKKRNYSSNLGFIYAYNDKELSGKYFLIDGQQRITTIYLLVLIIARKNKSVREHFERTFLFDGVSKLDYKVRETAHDFLHNLTSDFLNGIDNVEQQVWFYEKYRNDKTIASMLENIAFINKKLDDLNLDEYDFYYYLNDYIEFWYFDTNISEQGEELYIYMNARGEQVQSNENIKADLLSQLNKSDEKNKYGKLWEDWQDFFWLNRDEKKNANADKGFNEFLACISGLENLIDKKVEFYNKEKFDELGQIESNKLNRLLSIKKINKYINCLKYIEKNAEAFKNQYTYCKWVDNFLKEVWSLLNLEKTNWLSNFNDPNRGTERNRMVFLWSIFYYYSEDIDKNVFFRFIRIFYLRYNNYNRSVSTLIKTVDNFKEYSLSDLVNRSNNSFLNKTKENIEKYEDKSTLNFEEKQKLELLYEQIEKPIKQLKYEEVICQIEDHKLNLNGRDVGGNNITHLVDFDKVRSVEDLIVIRDKFYEVFPEDKANYLNVQAVLLTYGDYWQKVNPPYYENFKFDNWKRTIRGYEGAENFKNKTFLKFFNEFSKSHLGLNDFIKEKIDKYEYSDETINNSFRKQLIWYNIALDNKMWSKGNYIALRDWVPNDKRFNNQHKIFNTNGTFRGEKNNVELFELLDEETKAQILKKK